MYPAATKEQLDFFHATFQGNDRQIDEFGDKIVARPSGGFIAPVLDISPEFFSDLDSNGHKYEIVGHGKPLNDDCDAYVMTNGCLQVENHKKHAGLGFMHKIHHHCYNWRCPKDFFYGNAVRASGRITQKSNEKGLAIEAGAVSLPKSCYGLSESKMRAKSIGALFARDFLGGCLVFHPLRYKSAKWVDGKFHLSKFYYAPHYHYLGNFRNDYDVCRNCIHYNEWGSKSVKGKTKHTNHGGPDCLNCDKFEGLTNVCLKMMVLSSKSSVNESVSSILVCTNYLMRIPGKYKTRSHCNLDRKL